MYFFAARCNIIRVSWETKKKRLREENICVSDITVSTARHPSYLKYTETKIT